MLGNPFMYTGRRLDAETGLYYYRARYYDTQLGRFLSRDPNGYGDSLNLYEYVGGRPLNLTDPRGEFWSVLVTAAFAAVDTYQYATGNMSRAEYAASMALNAASLAADVMTGGMGGGLAVRGAAVAARVTQAASVAAKTLQRSRAGARVVSGLRATATATARAAQAVDRAQTAGNTVVAATELAEALVVGDECGNVAWGDAAAAALDLVGGGMPGRGRGRAGGGVRGSNGQGGSSGLTSGNAGHNPAAGNKPATCQHDCNTPGIQCFVPGTLVLTEHGPVAIERLRQGRHS
jgi:RHS repeat-associated protein